VVGRKQHVRSLGTAEHTLDRIAILDVSDDDFGSFVLQRLATRTVDHNSADRFPLR
jgi:hypothetical protein